MIDVRSDRGQATVLTVVFITALLGLSALTLDAGSWFHAQRATQSAADASALAAAQALPGEEEEEAASALAASYLDKNGGGVAGVSFDSKNAASDTVTVEVTRDTPGFFAKVFGVDTVEVDAKASARVSGLDAARWVAPIAVNIKHDKLNCGSDEEDRPIPCFGEPTELHLADLHRPGSGNAAGAFGLINLSRDQSGNTGTATLGDWILNGFDEYMELGDYPSAPSSAFNSNHIRSALDLRTGDQLLFPIYTKITGSGQNAVFDVVGWVGFTVTDFHATGSTGKVEGSFTEVIWEGIQSQSDANLNFGARAVALVE